MRNIDALAVRLDDFERLIELFLSRLPVAVQSSAPRRAEVLAGARHHPERPVLVIGGSNLHEAFQRLPFTGIGPPAEPAASRCALRESELVDECAHFIRDHGYAIHVPETDLNRASNQVVTRSAIGCPSRRARAYAAAGAHAPVLPGQGAQAAG